MFDRDPKLVIFDCDGVLVDSEPISLAVMIEALRAHGCELSEEDGYRHLLGRSLTSNAEWLRSERGFAMSPTLLSDMRARLFARFRAELEPVSNADLVLKALDVPMCVASSSNLDRVRLSLTVTGLSYHFEPHVFSAQMVERGKPAPDLFRHAARAMGVAPEDCLVVEDSPSGIQAAQAAGMRVIGFVGGSHAGPAHLRSAVTAAAPDAIIDDMTDMLDLLPLRV